MCIRKFLPVLILSLAVSFCETSALSFRSQTTVAKKAMELKEASLVKKYLVKAAKFYGGVLSADFIAYYLTSFINPKSSYLKRRISEYNPIFQTNLTLFSSSFLASLLYSVFVIKTDSNFRNGLLYNSILQAVLRSVPEIDAPKKT